MSMLRTFEEIEGKWALFKLGGNLGLFDIGC